MALIGQIAIAMKVQTAPLKKGLTQSAAMLHTFEARIHQTGTALKAIFAGAAFYGAVKGIQKVITAGSDLNETLSKTQAVFGDSAQTVIGAAQEMADSFGVSKNEFLGGAAVLGGIFKGAGFDPRAAADMAVQFSKLAGDVASFANVPVSEALDKLRAGLTGESEPLKSLGILINEDRVKAQAYAMGLARVGAQLTEQQKVQARAALITASLSDAQGDLAKTAGGVANSSRGLMGRIENLAADIGQLLLPVTQQALKALNGFATSVGKFLESNKGLITGWVDTASGAWDTFITGAANVVAAVGRLPGAFGAVSSSLAWLSDATDAIGFAWRNLPEIFGVAALKAQEKILNLVEYAQTIPANLKVIGEWISQHWVTLIRDAIVAVTTLFQNLGSNLAKLNASIVSFLTNPTQGFTLDWTPILEGFQAQTAKLPELIRPSLTSLQSEIDAKLDVIAKNELARSDRLARAAQERSNLAASAISSAAGKESAGALATKAKEAPKFASAMSAGSSEAVNTILRSRYGNQQAAEKNKPAEQTARNTQKIAEKLDTVPGLIADAVARALAGGNPLGAIGLGNF